MKWSATEILLLTIGMLALFFGLFAGYWWLAHQMAWWTFALTGTGSAYCYRMFRGLARDHKSTSNRRA